MRPAHWRSNRRGQVVDSCDISDIAQKRVNAAFVVGVRRLTTSTSRVEFF